MTTYRNLLIYGSLLLAVTWSGCGAAENSRPSPLAELEVSELAGERIAMASLLAGKPLLVWFWAPW